MGFLKKVGGAISSAVSVAAAPVTAPVQAVRDVASGSNPLQSTLGAVTQVSTALNPVTNQAPQLLNLSPNIAERLNTLPGGSMLSGALTSANSILSGDTSTKTMQEYYSSMAKLGAVSGGVVGAGALGGVVSAKLLSGDVQGAAGALIGEYGSEWGVPSEYKGLIDAAKNLPRPGSPTSPYASPATGSGSSLVADVSKKAVLGPVFMIGAVLVGAYYLARRKK